MFQYGLLCHSKTVISPWYAAQVATWQGWLFFIANNLHTYNSQNHPTALVNSTYLLHCHRQTKHNFVERFSDRNIASGMLYLMINECVDVVTMVTVFNLISRTRKYRLVQRLNMFALWSWPFVTVHCAKISDLNVVEKLICLLFFRINTYCV